MIKRVISLILFLALFASAALSLTSCTEGEKDGKIQIICTIFPQYDWMRRIIGESERVELTLLINNGNDMHSYDPTAADIMRIAECDMIVYLGENIDGWVAEAIERSGSEDIKSVALAECEGITHRDISSSSHSHDHEGHDHDHEHDHDHDHSHEGHDHGTLDEHIWLSLRNAAVLTQTLCDAICELDPDGAEEYRRNTAAYIEQINALDEKYAASVAEAEQEDRFMLFCDRFPFVYLLEDHHIEYAAAFEGCSADVDADFATVLRLIEEAEAHGVKQVVVTETSDGALANTVASSVRGREVEVLRMNSMQAVSSAQIGKGTTYLSIMEENLRVLRIALGIED